MSFKRSAECTWKMGCSLQWWDLWGRGWQLSKCTRPIFSFSSPQPKCTGKKNQQKSVRREVLFQLGVQVPQPPYRLHPSSMDQLRDVDSTNGISPNTPLLSSQLHAHPLLCLLKPVHWVHAVHVLSFAGLSSRAPGTPSHRGSTFHLHCYFPDHTWHLENSVFRAYWSHFS